MSLSNRSELIAAGKKILEARNALQVAAPNARDYSTAAAFTAARERHYQRVRALTEMHTALPMELRLTS